MTLNSHCWYTLYLFYSLCSTNVLAEFLNHLKYKHLKCLTFDAFWMLTGGYSRQKHLKM